MKFLSDILLWIFSVFGAIGGIIWAAGKVQVFWTKFRAKRNLREEHSTFYYQTLEIAAVISDNGSKWETKRQAVIFTKKPTDHIICGIKASHKKTDQISIAPTDLKLEAYTEPYSKLEKYRILFPEPLMPEKGLKWEISYNFEKVPPKEETLAWSSSLRVDQLILRVIFRERKPVVRWRVTDASDHELGGGVVPVDPITGEAKKIMPPPRPNLRYALIWQNNMEND